MGVETAVGAANHDPLSLALLVLLALATAVQMLVRRKHANGFSDEAAGQMKEKVMRLEREVQGFRDWRHDEYVKDVTKLQTQFVPRTEIELMRKDSQDDRDRLWAVVESLRRDIAR
jgi:hypothetical protein